jgi:hypothetical protein
MHAVAPSRGIADAVPDSPNTAVITISAANDKRFFSIVSSLSVS